MIFPDRKTILNRDLIEGIATASISGEAQRDREYAAIKRSTLAFIEGAIRGDKSAYISEIEELAFMTWILAALNENIVTARAIIRARDIIERQLANAQHNEDLEEFARRLSIDISVEGNILTKDHLYRVQIDDFATYASRVTGSRYRLSNQIVKNGYVYIQNEVLVRILEEAFVSFMFSVIDDIDEEAAIDALKPVSDDLARLRDAYRKAHNRGLMEGKGNIDMFPPCMKEIIKNLDSGINVSHMGRLALASFLHKVGYSEDEIVQYFRNAPDFEENITRYQIKHLSGEISGTEYTPPKCETMRSNHLCYMDDDPLCHREWMKHPLTYYEVKRKNRNIR
ncbi:DNA primase regulatory subunit PriL [Thermoplasma sp.]|uniref:DNA primase regulatory subunit PriL n=1 Tax=Thermoplasma sp. TaxID=1973142 RepID=UPI00260AE13A|nr:DNA primase regulatory subunit PriL [Thermoplasma sp.]